MTTRPTLANRGCNASPAQDAPRSLVGRVLDGRYRLDDVLSTGGMGIVFKATQLSVNRQIAVKILRPALAEQTDLVRRFSQEIEVVASLAHPNIVGMIDAGRDPGGLTYLAMEFFEGVTFREGLKSGEMSLPEILDVFVQTCEALMEAHAAGIIHRDLKFDNIMLGRHRDGRLHVKILDFGVAKLLSRDTHLTRNGEVPGTPGIIAPELIDEKPPTGQSDLYSLGVMLYTALSGAAPFRGDNDLELMRAHKLEPVPSLEGRVSNTVTPELLALTCEMLEKAPEDRPRGASDVRDRLVRVAQGLRHDGITYPYNPEVDAKPTLQWAGKAGLYESDGEPDDLSMMRERGLARPRPSQRGPVERFVRAFFGEVPVVAPMTVVFILSLLLFVLILTIIYLLTHGFGIV
ncbi:serine/threonine-protein kinase [Bradymonas sediminis]|nr:serine/threonine-protein kinase [Bradymonas sediminis]TDP75463.1 serine/threonine protein kinase [Bradymonas sediminis]